jgi:carboxylate-amine ligase
MTGAAKSYAFGIEEEYFVVDRRSGGLKAQLSKSFMKAAGKELGDRLTHEMLQCQIEIATRPLASPDRARDELKWCRRTLAEAGRARGIAIVAASTHPLARPLEQQATRKRRYTKIINDLGMVGLNNALCGLHVHVEVPDPDRRVDLMHRMVPYLPVLLALSTSSPFWMAAETGLLGYRNSVNDGLPRTGFPEMFRSEAEYDAYVRALVDAKVIPDASYIWWSVRPSLRHPTLELRLTDCCTSVDDAVAIASLYRALVRHLVEHRDVNADRSALTRALTHENRWRAQRYGTDGTYLDPATTEPKPFAQVLADTIALVRDDIEALDLAGEIVHLEQILQRGTSAHQQLACYRALRRAGRARVPALRALVRWLAASTEAGTFIDHQAHLVAA